MKKNVPNLSEIYNLLDQDFIQRNLSSLENPSEFQVVSNVQTHALINEAQSNYNQRQHKPICTHYGYTGHTTETCYKIHGYPTDFKHKNKSEKNFTTTKPSGYNKHVVAQLTLGDTEINGHLNNG